MMSNNTKSLVLCVYFTSAGYAFVLFEGAAPLDWDVRDFRRADQRPRILKSLQRLLERYRPDCLVVENSDEPESRRRERTRELYAQLMHAAHTLLIDVYRYTTADVLACFAPIGCKTKYELAWAVSAELQELQPYLPRKRKIGFEPDPRQGLFDAAALGITHLHRSQSTEGQDAEDATGRAADQ